MKPRVRMITPVWGADYIERWLDLGFASQLSEGNIPYLNECCDFELTVVTKVADIARLRLDAKFQSCTRGIRVSFVSMDEFLPPEGKVAYGIPLTLAYAKAILESGENALGTYVILMNADLILAAGSLKSLVDRIDKGFTIITATSIRTIDGTARSALYEHLDNGTGILTVAPRTMMRIANRHLHNTVTSSIVNDRGPIDSTHYHHIYWRISDGCIAMRGFLLQPLCFRVDRLMEKVFCPVDYGFITEICPDGRFCVLGDSDEYLMMELQERDTESHLLRIAPKSRDLDDWLSRLAREIAQRAATWTTAEHRRAATQTVLYHEDDLPPDLALRLSLFESFVDDILKALPPAASHIRHRYWLPAVRIYREDMKRLGATAAIGLLEDPRNLPSVAASELGD